MSYEGLPEPNFTVDVSADVGGSLVVPAIIKRVRLFLVFIRAGFR